MKQIVFNSSNLETWPVARLLNRKPMMNRVFAMIACSIPVQRSRDICSECWLVTLTIDRHGYRPFNSRLCPSCDVASLDSSFPFQFSSMKFKLMNHTTFQINRNEDENELVFVFLFVLSVFVITRGILSYLELVISK